MMFQNTVNKFSSTKLLREAVVEERERGEREREG
jgi:hypothetical protein